MSLKQKFRNIMRTKFRFLAIGLATTAIGLGVGLTRAAGNATLTLSPSGGSHAINTTFGVTVYENSSDPVIAVQADFSYDASKLQFISLDTSSSAFDTQYPSGGGGGTVKIARANSGGAMTGNRVVATVNFKVLTGSGSTALSFLSSSAVVRSSDNSNVWNGSPTGGTYTMTTPTPPPTPTPTPTPTPAPTPSPTPTPTPPSTVKPNNTPSPADPNVVAQQNNSEEPVPVSKNTSENMNYLVAIKVVDSKGQPIKDAQVTLDNRTVKSDATGVASFVNVPAGGYTAKIHSTLGASTININVDPAASPTEVQQFEVALKPKTTALPKVAITLSVLLFLFAVIGLGVFRKLTGRFPWTPTGNSGSPTPPTVPVQPTPPSSPTPPAPSPVTPSGASISNFAVHYPSIEERLNELKVVAPPTEKLVETTHLPEQPK